MSEFKSGSLKSSSGSKVTNRKQAIAIAMSEAGMSKGKGKSPKVKKPKGGSNPFFGNSLPFQLGDGSRWISDSRKMGASSFKKGK